MKTQTPKNTSYDFPITLKLLRAMFDFILIAHLYSRSFWFNKSI